MTEPLEPYSNQQLGLKIGGIPTKNIVIVVAGITTVALLIMMIR